jgi:hypothetical protein
MNDVFFVPTAIATVVSYLGLVSWLAAYLLSWGTVHEGLFLGIACGGLICGSLTGIAEPMKTEEGEEG